jgi:DeoR family transcriptional regulator of aga operon
MKSTVDRRDEIISIIKSEGSARVDELSEELDVSSVTIRNDLDFFEKKGLIHRTYGGALLRDRIYRDPAIDEKEKINVEEKRRIGGRAASLIKNGESIILDSGSTTREIALRLEGKEELAIMTNAINIAMELTGLKNCEVMLTGGVMRHKTYSLVGPEAEHTMQNYFFDKLFLGVDGINLNHGLTTSHPSEARLNRLMVERSNSVIAVTDSTKFGRHSFSYICDLDLLDMVITDTNIPANVEEDLKRQQITVVKV